MSEQKIPQGYKQTEVGVIPEDWLVEPLENFTSFISYGFTNPMPTTSSGPYMITAKDIDNGQIQYKGARTTDTLAFNKLLTPKSKPKKGDLLLTKDGTLGRLALVDDQLICINQSVAILRPNHKIVAQFFKLLLESPLYQERMFDDAGGSTIKHIYITIVNKMPLGLPANHEEQTLIATALSDVDNLISELEKLINKKQAIKTATMQQLLTGKTRLPQFSLRADGTKKGYKQSGLGEIPEDWEVYLLSLICDVRDGTHDSPKYKDNGIPLVTSKNIVDDILDLSNVSLISPEDAFKIDKRSKVDKGDIIMSMIGTVGSAVLLLEDPEFCIKNVALFKPKKVLGEFLVQLIRSKNFQDYLEGSMDGGIQKFVSLGTLRNMEISLPSEQEQIAIATILSDMDSEIQALEQRLVKTRQIKQGMMQELLTGKTRLVQPEARGV